MGTPAKWMHRVPSVGRLSTSSYASAEEGYESDVDQYATRSNRFSRVGVRNTTKNCQPPRWKSKLGGGTRLRSPGSPETTVQATGLAPNSDVPMDTSREQPATADVWYSGLDIKDDCSEMGRGPAAKLEALAQEKLEAIGDDDEVRTLDLYIASGSDIQLPLDSSTGNLHEAMKRLSTVQPTRDNRTCFNTPTRGREPSPTANYVSFTDGPSTTCPPRLRDRSLRSSLQRPFQRPSEPLVDPKAMDAVQVAVLLQEVKNISANIQDVNMSVERFAALAERVSKIEEVFMCEKQGRSGRRQDKPYAAPQRKEERANKLARSVRSVMDTLLDAHDEPFATEAEIKHFADLVKEKPESRCCTISNFKIDLQGGARSPWNASSALIFTEHYLITSNIPSEQADDVSNAFHTRVKSIKGSTQLSVQGKLAKGAYVRKYNLFHRRVEIVVNIPQLLEHLPFLQLLSIDGMSSDEEDGGETKSPTYRVLTPRWRSPELTIFLHILDSLYLLWRRLDRNRQRGGWPRVRRYDAKNIKLSNKTSYPKNLPRNAYWETWIQNFPNIPLSVNPGPAYNFTHHPESFRSVVRMLLRTMLQADKGPAPSFLYSLDPRFLAGGSANSP